eukprot:8734497-Lingulodinium_polyedra.AAC.1
MAQDSLASEAKVILLIFDTDWCCPWPRPQCSTPGCSHVEIVVDSQGVHLDAWREQAAGQAGLLSEAWQASQLDQVQEPVSILTLVMHLIVLLKTRYLAAQVLCAVSRWLEVKWLQMGLAKETPTANDAMGFEWLDWCEALQKKHQLNRKIASYVKSCQVCRGDWQYLSLASDKGDGGGLPMLQTVFAFPDNQAFLAVPQVDSLAFDLQTL